jgi:D-isomer specific 2-hydroxyacid dehydrogenase, NAD binding domain
MSAKPERGDGYDRYSRPHRAWLLPTTLSESPQILSQVDFAWPMDGPFGFALLQAESRCTTLPQEVLATWPHGVAALPDLNTAHLAGIALDVFPTEPYPAGGPLLAHPHVVATAHTASHTSDYFAAASRRLGKPRAAYLNYQLPQAPLTRPLLPSNQTPIAHSQTPREKARATCKSCN